MTTNSFIKKLGFSENDRVVITHADDVGVCQASVQAYEDLFNFGTLTSGAVMVPCPWFPAAADLQRRLPNADLSEEFKRHLEREGIKLIGYRAVRDAMRAA